MEQGKMGYDIFQLTGFIFYDINTNKNIVPGKQ